MKCLMCTFTESKSIVAQIFSKEVTKTVNFFQQTLPLTKVPAKRMLKRHLLVQRFLEKIPPRQNPLQVLFINLKLKLYSWYLCVQYFCLQEWLWGGFNKSNVSVPEAYTREAKKYCNMITNKVPFSTLSDAETACTADTNCTMIYDDECDNIGFHTCNGASGDSASSCVYTKGTPLLSN